MSYVTIVREDGWKFIWNGSKTVNVFRPDGIEIDVFSLGYDREHHLNEVIQACYEWELCLV